ncbi:MAG TPA: SMP-30/gluconolactonase/LRE family protein [Blastocatellia bacterium]|nr:SMP-30/gluconolactonase/LRE family protein [Blastocatellia bacterium]
MMINVNRLLAISAFALLMGCSMAEAQEVEVATIVAFTEGPAADREGNVYFTDAANNRIMRLATDRTLSTFRQPANYPNGMVFDPEWRLLVCEAGDSALGTPPRITRTDMKTGQIEVLTDNYEGMRYVAPNDITFDGQGRIYFTEQARTPILPPYQEVVRGRPAPTVPSYGVYRIDPDGRVTRILAGPDVQWPNGLMISPDDRTFYLVETNKAENGARMIRAYDLRPDGSVTNMRVFHNFYPGRSGDGMAIDVQGNLYVAAGLHRLRGTSETLDTRPGIHIFSPAGKLLRYIPVPEDTVTNCAFGGADMKTLYITAGKGLYRVRTEIEGTHR